MIIASFWDDLATLVTNFLGWIAEGVIIVLNLAIEGLGAIVSAALSLLPGMPSLPTMPPWFETGMQWSGYWFPVSFLLTTIALVATIWVVWIVVRIPLRWGKANPS